MNSLRFLPTVFLVFACLAAHGAAPPAPALPASAASAPTAPTKRPLPPDQVRDQGAVDDLRPRDMPPPQVSVPIGKKPPGPSAAVASAVERDEAASPNKVNDQVARCKGAPDVKRRAACARSSAASANGR